MNATRILPVAALAAAVLAMAAPAAETPPDGGPLEFRRVYAPLDQLEKWPWGSSQYLPVTPDRFEALRKAAGAVPLGEGGSTAAAIAAARYEAHLVGDELAGGEARWQIEQADQRVSMLNVEPSRLPMTDPVWSDSKARVQLGLSAEGKSQVFVERPGAMRFAWSLRGTRDAAGTLSFPLELPRSPRTELILHLPSGLVPLAEGAIVTATTKGAKETRWQLEVGGRRPLVLRVIAGDEGSRRRQMPSVRETLVYDFSLHGVDLLAQWQLEAAAEPLHQLVVSLSPEARLTSVRYGDLPVNWSRLSQGKQSHENRVVLELPEPLQGAGRTLRLGAIAPARWSQLATLPRLRSEGLFWQEGSATLLVPAPLALEELTIDRGRQIRVAPLAAPRTGESVEIQLFAPDAVLKTRLGQPQAPLRVDTADWLKLGRGEIRGKVSAMLRVAQGERFALEAAVPSPWSVDSVECTPADALEDWTFQRRAEPQPAALAIRLARPLSPARPLRLVLGVRRSGLPPGRVPTLDDLAPLRFSAESGRRLLALANADPYRLRLEGVQRQGRLTPEERAALPNDLFVEPPGELVLDRGAAAGGLRVVVDAQRSSYAVNIRVEAGVRDGLLNESYLFHCTPDGAPVERLLLSFSAARSAPLVFRLAGDESQVMAQRLGPEGKGAAEGARAEVWEVVLRKPQTAAFDLTALRSTPLAAPQSISLSAAPDAARQEGSLVIRAIGASQASIENHRLQAVLPEVPSPGQYSTVQAAFRYLPEEDVDPADPAVEIAAVPTSDATPAAWVWDFDLRSRYGTDGHARHSAVYRLQSNGQNRLVLVLPEELERIHGVWVDDARASWRRLDPEDPRRLSVDLPRGRRYPLVAVSFTTSGRALPAISELSPPLPDPGVPVMDGRWTAWLPPGFEASGESAWQAGLGKITWTERLFGPLGRPNGRRPFTPLDRRAWMGIVSADGPDARAHRQAAQLLQQIGQRIADAQSSGQRLDWGSLLTDRALDAVLTPTTESGSPVESPEPGGESSPLALLVDRREMSRLGLGPRTPLEPPAPQAPSARGLAVLQRTGLALVVHSQAIVLTSVQSVTAFQGAHCQVLQPPTVWFVQAGVLDESIASAVSGNENGLVSAGIWNHGPPAPPPPWALPTRTVEDADETLGWTACRLDLGDAAAARLVVVHGATRRAAGWIAFLVGAAVASWLGNCRPGIRLVGLGLCGTAAFWLPLACAPLASGAMLGWIAGWTIRWLGQRGPTVARPRKSEPSAPSSGRVSISTHAARVLLLVALTCPEVAIGAETTPDRSARPPVARVFVPIDAKQQPSGNKIFVPEAFYSELERRAARSSQRPLGWLLTDGTYRATLGWQSNPERMAVTQLKAVFNLQLFGGAHAVRFALGNDAASIVAEGVQLDGRPVPFQWRDGSLQIGELPDPGLYRLEISLVPTPVAVSDSMGFDLRIPRLASSRLELTVPVDAPPIDIPGAMGSAGQSADPLQWTAELGPIERLSVRWPEGGRGTAGKSLDVEELLWLKVQPGAVSLDARWKVKAVQGRVSHLRLAADPRLRVQPLPPESPIAKVQAIPGESQKLGLELLRPLSGPTVLDLSFLWTGVSGVGRLRLPSLGIRDARVTRRWLAVSVDAALKYGPDADKRRETVAPATFLSAWGTADAPQLACSLAADEPDWSLSVWPSEARTTAEAVIALVAEEETMRVRVDARLQTVAGANFLYRLGAPKDLTVEKVSLVQAGIERVARWTRGSNGALTVFLSGPVTGRQEFLLQGRLLRAARRALSMPLIRFEGVETPSSALQLYREDTVAVSVEDVAGLTEAEATIDAGRTGSARLVKAWTLGKASPAGDSSAPAAPAATGAAGSPAAPKAPSLVLLTRPNRPKWTYDQVTWLRVVGDQWEADVDLRIRAAEGLLDEISLEAPANWNCRSANPAGMRQETLPADRRLLVVRPAAAIQGDYALMLSGPLAFRTGEPVLAPRVVVIGAEPGRRYLVLPNQFQFQPITWSSRGLRGGVLPGELDPPAQAAPGRLAREARLIYQVQGRSFQASLRPLERPSVAAQVYLAEISLAWLDDGTCRGIASFDLEAADLSECRLRLPPGLHPLSATIDGATTPMVAADEHRWRLPVSGTGMPRRVEVVLLGSLGLTDFEDLAAPALEGLPVQQVLWRLGPPPGQTIELGAGQPKTDSQQYQMVRLRSAVALAEQGSEVVVGGRSALAAWHQAWTLRWQTLREEIDRLLPAARGDVIQSIQAELQALDRRQTQVAARLALAPPKPAGGLIRPSSDPGQLWWHSLEDPGNVVHLVTPGTTSEIQFRVVSAAGGATADALKRSLLLWLGLAGVALVAGRAGALPRLPHATLAILLGGLAWWYWLEPSALGLAAAILAAAALLRALWRRRPGSIAIRSWRP